jgi:hypothetical protein
LSSTALANPLDPSSSSSYIGSTSVASTTSSSDVVSLAVQPVTKFITLREWASRQNKKEPSASDPDSSESVEGNDDLEMAPGARCVRVPRARWFPLSHEARLAFLERFLNHRPPASSSITPSDSTVDQPKQEIGGELARSGEDGGDKTGEDMDIDVNDDL